MARSTHIPLEASEVVHRSGARLVRERLGRSEKIRVTVVLKSAELPRNHPTTRKISQIRSALPHQRPRLTRREYEEFHSANDADVRSVRQFARAFGLDVVEVSLARHDVVLEGNWRALKKAFRVDLRHYAHHRGVYRAHPGCVHVPNEIRDAVECVLGLDDIPLLNRPHVSPSPAAKTQSILITPPDLAQYYRFPTEANGAGQRIALIEFGGGYHPSDVQAYFKKLRIKPPKISDKSVDGGKNDPLDKTVLEEMVAAFNSDPAAAQKKYGEDFARFAQTVEVTMDIQVAGSLAPGAELVVYFSPPTAQAWRRSLYAALDKPAASVISISWGNAEFNFSESDVLGVSDALNAAALRHVTVCCSSGDFGSRATSPGEEPNGLANVAFPASSPLALACGGTTLQYASTKITGEVAWNDPALGVRFATGGGVSGRFAQPDFQGRENVPAPESLSPTKTWLSQQNSAERKYRGRGVPDVAADADSATGYKIFVGGHDFTGGGTSAVAPLWAALVARLNQSLGFQLGWLNPALYRSEVAQTFRPVRKGNNDVCDGEIAYYRAASGWNACTGIGTPDGDRLLEALRRMSR